MTLTSSLTTKSYARETLGLEHTREFAENVFGDGLHALRVLSLANGVAGVLNASVLSIHAIGQAYGHLAKITGKSGIKQIDRLLSNDGIVLEDVMSRWASYVVGDADSVVLAIDWTDFDADDHTTLCVYMITNHGRAMPLAWRTVEKSKLKDRRTRYELEMVEALHSWLPEKVGITVLADRAFGNQELYNILDGLGWDYVIRFRGCIRVEAAHGKAHPAEEWLRINGRPRMLKDARVTADRTAVGAVVAVKGRGMKEAWYLATSLKKRTAIEVVKLYGRRFTIEETFRDTKDLHFGMGLKATHIRDCARRDRMLLLVAIAYALITLLGAASEEAGLDRYLKANTVKRRTHSLYRQGLYWYRCLPTMRDDWFKRLIFAYDRIVREHAFFSLFFEVK
jgi:hypothetical protein